MRGTLPLSEELAAYLRSVSVRETEVQRRLREETGRHPEAHLQIAPEQGQLMGLLARLMGARNALEVGVFTGYSALAVALALPPDGRLVACDVNEAWTSIARRYWREAGVENRIDLRLGPALRTLEALLAEGAAGTFDLAFIDADKLNYPNYYERCLELVRPGGLILVDNVLWKGKLIDASIDDRETRLMRTFNEALHRDERIWISMVPIGDGLTLAVKR